MMGEVETLEVTRKIAKLLGTRERKGGNHGLKKLRLPGIR